MVLSSGREERVSAFYVHESRTSGIRVRTQVVLDELQVNPNRQVVGELDRTLHSA